MTYSTLVESLKRLYANGTGTVVTIAKLEQMKSEGKISQEEFNYITSA